MTAKPKPKPGTGNRAASRMAQALVLHQQGKMTEAAACYRDVLVSQPAQADALHLLGLIELQTNKPAQAIDWISRAIASDGLHPAFHSNLGIALEGVNRLEEAVASYGPALKLNGSYAEAHYNRGNALDKLDQSEAALPRRLSRRRTGNSVWACRQGCVSAWFGVATPGTPTTPIAASRWLT